MMVKSSLLLRVLSVLSKLISSVASLPYQEAVQIVDYSAVRFGFPCHYVEHVPVTFADSTNRWYFIGENLVTDVNLYFLLSLGLWSADLNRFRPEAQGTLEPKKSHENSLQYLFTNKFYGFFRACLLESCQGATENAREARSMIERNIAHFTKELFDRAPDYQNSTKISVQLSNQLSLVKNI